MQSKLVTILKTNQFGGRVQVTGPSSCLVLDLPAWTHAAHQELLTHFPHALVDVETCGHSLGGFALWIRDREPETRRTLAWVSLMAILGTVIAYTLKLF